MAGAIVQLPTLVVDEGAASTTISQTITGVTAGNALVAFVGWDDASTTTCSVSDGSAYSVGAAKITDGNLQAGQVFYLENAGAGSHNVVATFSQAIDFRRLRLFEVSGVLTSSALATAGVGQAQNNPGTGANAVSSGATASTGAVCFVMGLSQNCSQGSPGTGTVTAGTGYTIIGSSLILSAEYKAGAASGAQTATFTQSVNNDRITHVIALKEIVSGGANQFARDSRSGAGGMRDLTGGMSASSIIVPPHRIFLPTWRPPRPPASYRASNSSKRPAFVRGVSF